jgi:thiamine biosynthesis lipoprotein
VSVLNDSGARADAWATALIVLGPTEGPRTATRLHLTALFISRAGDHFDAQRTSAFP